MTLTLKTGTHFYKVELTNNAGNPLTSEELDASLAKIADKVNGTRAQLIQLFAYETREPDDFCVGGKPEMQYRALIHLPEEE